jgi:hypothetical protein
MENTATEKRGIFEWPKDAASVEAMNILAIAMTQPGLSYVGFELLCHAMDYIRETR